MAGLEAFGSNGTSETGGLLGKSILESAVLSTSLEDNSAYLGLSQALKTAIGSDPLTSQLNAVATNFANSLLTSNQNPITNSVIPSTNNSLLTTNQDPLTGTNKNTPLVSTTTPDPLTGNKSANNTLTAAIPVAPKIPNYAIRSEGTVTVNGSSDFDGDPLDLSDDALIYGAKGFTINGNATLPVQRDAAGNVIKDTKGLPLLVDKAVAVSTGYSTSSGPSNKYAGLLPAPVIPQQTVVIPAYSDIVERELLRRTPANAPTVTFNAATNPINNSSQWASKFPAPGTASNPTLVRVTGGSLTIPSNVNLSNYIITVDGGDINFNGSNHNLNNVVLIAKSGNINLANVQASDVSVFASGSISASGGAKFAGRSLLANASGNINFDGATKTTNIGDRLTVISQGSIAYNGASNTRGTFLSSKDFTYNGKSTLYGSISAKGNILFNGNTTVIADFADPTAPTISATLVRDTAPDSKTNTDRITFDSAIKGTVTDASVVTSFKAGFDSASTSNFVSVLPQLANDGSFKFTASQLATIAGGTLADGVHTLHLQAQDLYGNLSPVFDFTFTLDRAVPLLNLQTPLNTAPLTPQTRLTGTVNGTGSAVAQISYRFDERSPVAIAIDAAGAFNQEIDYTGINSGLHTLTITTTDVAGNVTKNAYNVTVKLDITPPAISATLARDTAPGGTTNSDRITSDPTISGTVTDLSKVATFTASLDGINYVNVLPQRQQDGSFNLSRAQLETIAGKGLTDGNYTLHLMATDEYGNASPSTNFTFTLDTKVNTPTNLKLAPGSDTGSSISDNITKTNPPTITGTGDVGATVKLTEGTTLVGQATVGSDGKWQVTTTQLSEGSHSLTATATDIAGNVSTPATPLNVNIDTVAPQLQLAQELAGIVLGGASHLKGQVTDSNIVAISYQFDGAPAINLPNGTQFDTPFDFTGISDGAHNLTVTATDIAGNSTSRVYGVTVARGALLTLALLNDTGTSNSDGITSDINVRGQVADRHQISRLEFALDGNNNYSDLTAALQLDGSFRLLPAQLDSLAGGKLNLGAHSLVARGVLADGSTVSTTTLNFTYTTANTNRPTLNLAKTSDTGVIGDLVTSAPAVDLVAHTQAGITVKLGTLTTVADANGVATFTGVNLTLGNNLFTVTTVAANGETANSDTTITRTNPDDVILTWNHIALNAIRRENTPPPAAARVLAMVHTAMYDAVNAIEQKYGVYRVDATGITGADEVAAAAEAAAKVLAAIYPNQQAYFNTALDNSLRNGASAEARTKGIAVGDTVAANILAWRQQDGSRTAVAFNPSIEIGKWQPDLPNYDGALLPQWGSVTTFALTNGAQFRPSAPPLLTSDAYTQAFNETKDYGARDSALRTDDQTQIALFWADGSGTYTPSGHWNDIAATAASIAGKSILDNARTFALLNVAMADAGIAAWDSKYTYDTWRPITAIRQADKDGNANTTVDPNWVPLIYTPPFPEYVSGHSTFSGAAATVLDWAFGANFSFNSGSTGLPDVTRSFTSFDAAANEAGQSRIYGGIHFQFSNQAGLALGKQIGNYVAANLMLDNSQSPIQVALATDTAAFGTTNRDRITSSAAITGQINLVQPNLQLQLAAGGGTFVDITSLVGADGKFQIDATKLATIVGPLTDKTYQLTFKLLDNNGQTVGTNNFNFTLDKTASTVTINPLDGNVTPTVHLTGTANDSNGGTSGRFRVDGGSWTSFNVLANGTFDKVVNPQGLSAGTHAVELEIADLAGNTTAQTVSFNVDSGSNIYVSPATNPGWGRVFANGFSLAEGNSLVSQNTIGVELGGAGKRTLDFDLQANLDKSDVKSFGKDRVAVYLVDDNNNPLALDATHPGGVPLFSLSETGSEIIPGLVRFDGTHVQIDVSNVAATRGKLVVQLLNQDGDSGSNLRVTNFSDSLDPLGTPGTSVGISTTRVAPGTSVILDSYLGTGNAQLLLSNVSFDKNTGKYTADLRVQNVGTTPLSHHLAVLLTGLPAGVTVANASGIHPAGSPYLNFDTAIKAGGLAGGTISDAVSVVINDPSLAAFSFKPVVLQGAADAPPDLSSLKTLTVKVGDKLDIPLQGAGSQLTLAIKTDVKLPTGQLTGDNHMVFTPAPDQIGSYTFTLIAKNGNLETRQDITLNVVADPIATTRVTGTIADTNQAGLANVLVELSGYQATTDAQGKFTIVLPDGTAGDTLKVYGQRIQGGGITYPFIAEKMPLLLGHDIYRGVNNQIDRPIYLPLIDVSTGTTVNPTAETFVTNPKLTGAKVDVAAGSLFDKAGNAFAGIMSITEVPTTLTPAALPENLHPDLVVTVQPGDMVFNTPAKLTLPNRAGYLPGLEMDLWSINPNTGTFDIVGKGRVSDDGSVIETIEGGIRNSSWHFFGPPPPNINLHNSYELEKVCKTCEDKQSYKSEVSSATGIVSDDRELLTYQSQGIARGVNLHYDSGRANPNRIFRINADIDNPIFGQDLLTAKVSIVANGITQTLPGLNSAQAVGISGGERVWTFTTNHINTAIQGDLNHLQSGVYQSNLEVGISGTRVSGDGTIGLYGSTQTQTDKVIVVNDSDSVFGAGWNVSGLQKLVINQDNSALLIEGDGSQWLFDPATGDTFVSPAGDFSRLEKLADGRFLRTTKDGTRYEFNAQGYMTQATDRLGNVTQHTYNGAGQIQAIVDPVGLTTRFYYTGSRVTRIVDPAGRTTVLNYDGQGNLVSITDPDGTTKSQYGYDSNHNVISSVDKNGQVKTGSYDEFGRAKTATREDGTIVQINPLEVQGLLNQAQTTNLANPITLSTSPATSTSTYIDANGRVIHTTLDNRGEVVNRLDEFGLQTANIRNNNYLVTSQFDGNGHAVRYEYDLQGNVIKVEEQIVVDTIVNSTGNLFSSNIRSIPKPVGGYSTVTVSGDINNDGFADIITTTSENQLNVLLGDNQGSLSRAYTIPSSTIYASTNITQLELEDVNGDGDLDLIANLPIDQYVGNGYGTQSALAALSLDPVLVFLNQGNGQFADATILPFQATSDGFVLGDFNGDDKLDVLARMDIYSSQSTNSYPVILYAGDGAGQFTEQPISFPGIDNDSYFTGGGANVEAVDIDGDGREEVVFNLYDRLSTFKYDPITLAWVNTNDYSSDFSTSRTGMVTGDINGDGLGDIVTFGYSQVNVLLGRADGKVSDRTFNVTDDDFYLPELVKITDSNGDGKSDLVLAGENFNQTGLTVKVYDLNSSGNLVQLGNTLEISQPFGQYQFTDVADIDGDGDFDLILNSSYSDLIGIIDNQSIVSQTTSLTKSYIYDTKFNQLTSVTDELGHQTLYDIDPTNGNVRSITRVVGAIGGSDDVVTSYTYTSKGQVDLITDALGHITDYDYDNYDRLVKLTTAKGTLDQAVEQYQYDNAGNRIATIDALGHRTIYTYNSMNMLLQTTDANGGTNTYNYDRMGNQTSVTDANGHVTRMTYDSRGRLVSTIDANGGTSKNTYDNHGNLLSSTDALGRASSYQYDARNRLIKTIAADGSFTTTNYDLNDNVIGSTDELGYETQQFYDARNRLSREVDALGNQAKYSYDAANQLIAVTDVQGHITQYEYDDLGRQVAVIDANGQITRTQYDKLGNVIATIDANGNRTEYAYDALNRQIQVKDALGGITRTAYNKVGNAIYTTDALNHTTSFNYDALDRLTATTDALNHTSTISYDAAGNVLSTTDALGRTTSYNYDVLDRQIKSTDALGHTATTSYDAVGNILATTDQLGRTTSYVYDNRDRLITTTDALGHATNLSYDAVGNTIAKTDALGRTTTYSYDALDRLIQTTDALNQQQAIAYDAMGNVVSTTDELGRTTTYTYDAVNHQTEITDALGHRTTNSYDAVGNVIQVTNALGQATKYIYDSLNRQIETIDAKNQITAVGYDAVGNILTLTDAVGNTTSYTYDALDRLLTDTNSLGNTRSYSYDAVGNITRTTDRNGRVRTFSHDALDRQTAENWLSNSGNSIYTVSYTYDAASQLISASDPNSSYSYTYDAVGQLISVNNAGTLGVPHVLLNYSYDAVGNKLSVTDTINGQLAGEEFFTYDALNRTTRITQTGNGVTGKRIDMTYDATSQLTNLTRYADISGTQIVATSNYVYDNAGRLTNLTHSRGGNAIASYTWAYDQINRITAFTSPDGTSTYNYDATNQLTSTDHSFQANEAYSYDANGNRTNAGYANGSNNQLLSNGKYNYEYDAEGNRTRRIEIATGEVTQYSWDYKNRLTQVVVIDASGNIVSQADYTYDVFNRRIAKVVDTDGAGSATAVEERFVYDGDNIALVFDGNGNQTERYFYGTGVDQVLAEEKAQGEVLWALTDNQGTVRDLIDSNGTVLNHITYDSYGQVTSESNSAVDLRFGYTGREFDAETGQYYYRARYYDAGNGEFISSDPIGFASGDTNLYRYVSNSPLNAIDPTGLEGDNLLEPITRPINDAFWWGVGGAAAGIIGGGAYLWQKGSQLLPKPERKKEKTPNPSSRPTSDPTPTPAPSPSSSPIPPYNPNDCDNKKKKTCKSEYHKYPLISEATSSDLYFGGFKNKNTAEAISSMKNNRGRYLPKVIVPNSNPIRYKSDPTSQLSLVVEPKGKTMDRLRFSDPEGFARHYNVFLDSKAGYGDKMSAGSIGRYKFCDDTNGKPPQLVPRYGILNIKSVSGQKYGVLNDQLIRIN